MVSPPFLQYIVDHARDLVLENASLLLVLSILNYSLGMLFFTKLCNMKIYI